MFNPFKKKKKEGDEEKPPEGEEGAGGDEEEKEKKPEKSLSSEINDPKLLKFATEIDKLKAGQEAFQEIRKSMTERANLMSEQIGELRAMILDRDRAIQEIELKAVKAADLVSSVEPEKLMTEIQKQDVKIEALKANLEGNESIMGRVMDELSETRKKIEFFRGIEEIIKLSEEVKKELIEVKKVEGTININTDKVQTMYAEIRNKLQDIDTFKSEIQEVKVNAEQAGKDATFLKGKVANLATKEELDKLVKKVQGYIDSLKDIQKRSSLTKDIDQLKTIVDSLK